MTLFAGFNTISFMYELIHIIHLYAAFTYGGFLIVDNLFLTKMSATLSEEETAKAREAIMIQVRKVVPYALFVAVFTGGYMFGHVFGKVEGTLSKFQLLLSIKASLGMWLGLRGFNQKVFHINPFLFKSHVFPFVVVLVIILLSQLMYL